MGVEEVTRRARGQTEASGRPEVKEEEQEEADR